MDSEKPAKSPLEGMGPVAVAVVAVLTIMLFMFAPYRSSPHWTTTTGKITSVTVTPDLQAPATAGLSGYTVSCKFRYLIDGLPRDGEQTSFPKRMESLNTSGGPAKYGRHDAEELAANFPQGKDVPVYADPKDPNHAVVETDDQNK